MEMLKPVIHPLPWTGKKISVVAKGEAQAELDILSTVPSFQKKAV